jgi:hypothetical protein
VGYKRSMRLEYGTKLRGWGNRFIPPIYDRLAVSARARQILRKESDTGGWGFQLKVQTAGDRPLTGIPHGKRQVSGRVRTFFLN